MTSPPTPPDTAVAELVPGDVPRDPTRLRHPSELDLWYGHVWSRLGHAAHAWQWWSQVDAPMLQPRVAVEKGRVLRELGLHAAAAEIEQAGLAVATDPVDIVALRLGLAADAVGAGEAETARLRLTGASELLDALPDTPPVARQRLRRSWVEVEVAIAEGDEPPAGSLPAWEDDGSRFPADYGAGTRFHRAKGLLFAGIVRGEPRLLDAAAEEAPPVLRWAVELARADRGVQGALARAREAWSAVTPPPGCEDAVAATPTARRLTAAR